MLDLGWQELMIIMIVGIIVVGPSEFPRVLRGVRTAYLGFRRMVDRGRSSVQDVMREIDLKEFEKEIKQVPAVDPIRTIGQDLKSMVKGAVEETKSQIDPSIAHDMVSASKTSAPKNKEAREAEALGSKNKEDTKVAE